MPPYMQCSLKPNPRRRKENSMPFDAKQVTEDLVHWLCDIFAANGKDCKAVVGLSGGKDSTLVAALCVQALGKERVVGVLMPNGVQQDIEDARAVARHLGITSYEINIQAAYKGVLEEVSHHLCASDQTKINLAPRLRMATLYAVAQSVNGRVMNTSNLSEAWVGYSTRYGDGAGDFAPLLHLTVTELKQIGRELNLPLYLVDKTPSDGLSGKTDEDKLGFTYTVLDEYIRTGVCNDPVSKERIDRLHAQNRFKQLPMPSFPYACD